jgi:hypothetical protein
MTKKYIKNYVAKNFCPLCENKKRCIPQSKCSVINAIEEITDRKNQILKQGEKIISNLLKVINKYQEDYTNPLIDEQVSEAERFLEKINI